MDIGTGLLAMPIDALVPDYQDTTQVNRQFRKLAFCRFVEHGASFEAGFNSSSLVSFNLSY